MMNESILAELNLSSILKMLIIYRGKRFARSNMLAEETFEKYNLNTLHCITIT